ncbi:HAD family hydrolase [Leptospira levettii]|uniref:HAD family phosphatase n=4 Tax=Leptospira levettii TaxID=2023178 RepID=A0AAW5V7V7_9LEPT|nr:HAD family phosphatase [Leptospira levettii]MCW7465353.1 HAD family phosphatase [Leptospira levettii]MCW7510093.1 HAD family phosphatase [Leptospira levettii]MCW7513844.1 HAD family phosphatase [Leptospira levettii]TGM92432.1 HAD family phosphatase [Leptospira levettii]
MKHKGFIFDMDGVVVDNHKFHFKAWMEFSKKYKFPLDSNIYRDTYNGKTNADLFRMIFGEISLEEIQNYGAEKENLYQTLYKQEMKPHLGIIEFFQYLKSKQMKLALGTSAPTMNVSFTLDNLDLRSYFDVIIDGSMVTQGKPHPEVYELCAKGLDFSPKDCIVFEDSIAGLQSGKTAGCSILGVATSHTVEELKPHVEQIISDFTDPLVFTL